MTRSVIVTITTLFGLFSFLTHANCARILPTETLPIVPGKSVGPISLGMTLLQVIHLVRGFPNTGFGDPYTGAIWDNVIDWSLYHETFGTLRVICNNDQVVQIDISTSAKDVKVPSTDAEFAANTLDEDKPDLPMMKNSLAHLVLMTSPYMKMSFQQLRQAHPGMVVSEYCDSDSPLLTRSYYYIDDVKKGIAFTYLAEDTWDSPKTKVQNLKPSDTPERIIIHKPGTRVLALYEDGEQQSPNPIPFLPQIRAWFATGARAAQEK